MSAREIRMIDGQFWYIQSEHEDSIEPTPVHDDFIDSLSWSTTSTEGFNKFFIQTTKTIKEALDLGKIHTYGYLYGGAPFDTCVYDEMDSKVVLFPGWPLPRCLPMHVQGRMKCNKGRKHVQHVRNYARPW